MVVSRGSTGSVTAVVVLASFAWSQATFAQTTRPAPATRSVPSSLNREKHNEKAEPNPIPDAVKVLLKEFEEAQGPNRTLTRKSADYFSKETTRPTIDQVFKALDQRFGREARADAYVKWQLLSAVPVTTDEKQVLRLVQAFKRATPPLPNPLLDPRQRSQVEQLASRMRPGSDVDPDLSLRQLSDKYFDANRPLLGYRDDLLARMPVSAGKLQLVWEELALRTKLGIEIGEERDKAMTATNEWAKTARPPELTAISQLLSRVRGTESDEILRRYKQDKREWDRWPYRLEWEDNIQKLINRLNQQARDR